jgi:hypothetical protein
MDTYIYIGIGLQIFLQKVNLWVDALSRQKTMEGISYQVCILFDNIHFKPLHVLCLQLIGVYISKKVIDLHEYITYRI